MTSPLHILLVVRALPRHRPGGLEYHTRDLASGLVSAGHRVSIITTPGGDETLDSLPASVSVQVCGSGSPGNYSPSFWKSLPRAIAQTVTLHGPADILHTQEFAGLFLGGRPPGIRRWVATIHGTMTTEVPLDRRYWPHLSLAQRVSAVRKYAPRILLQLPFRRMLHRPDQLIVDSLFTQRELTRLGTPSSKVTVVPCGIDFSRYSTPQPATSDLQAPLRVVLLGRLQRMKGIEIALRGLARAVNLGAQISMQVGGAGEDLSWAIHLADELGVAQHVQFHGRIPPESLAEFLGQGDVFLFPDLTQPAFGLVAVEAMHHGLPVIASRSGAIPEVITPETGFLYDAWDSDQCAETLFQAWKSRAVLGRMKDVCRKRAAVFNHHTMAANTLQVYLAQ